MRVIWVCAILPYRDEFPADGSVLMDATARIALETPLCRASSEWSSITIMFSLRTSVRLFTIAETTKFRTLGQREAGRFPAATLTNFP